MQTKPRTRINLRGKGDLIAAVPHLLGFTPTNSVVVCVYTGATRSQITLCLRVDIPPPGLHLALAEQLTRPVLRANSCDISVIIVSGGTVIPANPLPHKHLIDTFAQVFGAAGVVVHHAYWVPAIEANAPWWCYSDLDCNGLVPDPGATELAATAACMGTVTYDSKADIRATLEPPDRSLLPVRADRIAAALSLPRNETAAHRLLDDLVGKVREGTWTLEEEQVADLAVALKNVRVRDGCLCPEVTSIGRPIEEAWSALTRAFPDPYRAEPACLLALTAFLRGDGVLAGIAVEIALQSDPDHSFAALLRTSMDYGLPPTSVATALAQAFADLHDPYEPHDSHPAPPPGSPQSSPSSLSSLSSLSPPTPYNPHALEIHTTETTEPHPPHPPPSAEAPHPPESLGPVHPPGAACMPEPPHQQEPFSPPESPPPNHD